MFFPMVAQAQIAKIKSAPATPIEEIAEIDGGIARALASQFANPTADQFELLVAARVKVCSKVHKQCIDTSKWAKWSCRGGYEAQLGSMYNLWNSAAQETKTEVEGRAIWAAMQKCSAKPSAVQTAMALLLAKEFYVKKWTGLMNSLVWPWLRDNLATRPSPAEFGIPFVTRVVVDAELLKPTPYAILGDLAAQTVKWPPLTVDVKLQAGVFAEWLARISRVLGLAGRGSLVPAFVEMHQVALAPLDLQAGSALVSAYCAAVRDMGTPNQCVQFIERRFQKTIHVTLESERAITKFEAGDLEGASQTLSAAVTEAAKSKESESAMNVDLALVAGFQGRHEEALKSINAAAFSGQMPPEQVEMEATKVGILRRMGNLAEAAKVIEKSRQTIVETAQGPFTPAIQLEYEALLVAMQNKNKAQAKRAVQGMKVRFTGDKTQTYFRLAVAATEKKLAGQPVEADLVLVEKAKGAAYPPFKEFSTLIKNI